MRQSFIPFIALLFALPACLDTKRKPQSDKVVHVEHKIRGEEGSDFVTVLLQFRQSGSGKNELMGNVQLDRQPIEGGSSEIGGGFYEARVPADSFDGAHTIRYENGEGKVVTDSFYFRRFNLSELPPLVNGADWQILFQDIKNGDRILVALTDTAFQTDDIVQVDTVQNGKIQIPAAKLTRLANGPLHLELSVLQTKSPGNGAKGSIEMEYRLRRDVIKRE